MGRDRNKWEDMEEMTRGYVMVYRYTVLQSNGHMMHMHVAYIYIYRNHQTTSASGYENTLQTQGQNITL